LYAGHERGTGPDLGHEVVRAQRGDGLLQNGLQVRGVITSIPVFYAGSTRASLSIRRGCRGDDPSGRAPP
jgi:hypothetical protein